MSDPDLTSSEEDITVELDDWNVVYIALGAVAVAVAATLYLQQKFSKTPNPDKETQ